MRLRANFFRSESQAVRSFCEVASCHYRQQLLEKRFQTGMVDVQPVFSVLIELEQDTLTCLALFGLN